jgi:hypothetical protein
MMNSQTSLETNSMFSHDRKKNERGSQELKIVLPSSDIWGRLF